MLKKFLLKPGVNRENTRYTTEGGWYESDKVRFRQGTPEKIGGWVRISSEFFLGVCRSLWSWVTLRSYKLLGVMTTQRQYVELNGSYMFIGGDPGALFYGPTGIVSLSTTAGSSTMTVALDVAAPGSLGVTNNWVGSWLRIQNSVGVTGSVPASLLNNNAFTILSYNPFATPNPTMTVNLGFNALTTTTTSQVAFLTTASFNEPLSYGSLSNLYSQSNFGQDLIFGRRGGAMFIWDGNLAFLIGQSLSVSISIASPAIVTFIATIPYTIAGRMRVQFTGELPTGLFQNTFYYLQDMGAGFHIYAAMSGGSPINTTSPIQYQLPFSIPNPTQVLPCAISQFDVSSTGGPPTSPDAITGQNFILVSDIFRFVFAFGVVNYGDGDISNPAEEGLIDPMLLRWSDQESYVDWTPAATNQAGSLRLSRGSEIVTAIQARQEILVWTDVAVYSLQYLSADPWWGAQLVGDNISIVSQNAVAYASSTAYWMGKDKFYVYNGTVATLRCDLRQYVFSDINTSEYAQIFSGTNEGFNEVWWFYCSAASSTVNRYVIYNYVEDIWYYGSLARSAWIDSGTYESPRAATYISNLVAHEIGVDDNSTGTAVPIAASITSAEFDADDGDKFVFIKRVLPDLTFRNSTAPSPSGVLSFNVLKNSGSGYMSPTSEGGNSNVTVAKTATFPIEAFTGQVYVRLRARQLSMKWESTDLGVTWQLGSMRLDMQPDGKASGSGVSGG
jgi:hypothetical protein